MDGWMDLTLLFLCSFPSVFCLYYCRLSFHTSRPCNSKRTHLFKGMHSFFLSIHLSIAPTHTFFTYTWGCSSRRVTYLGYLLQTVHMLLMKVTWFMTPDRSMHPSLSHFCFYAKTSLSIKGQDHLAEHPGKADSSSTNLISQNEKKILSRGRLDVFMWNDLSDKSRCDLYLWLCCS